MQNAMIGNYRDWDGGSTKEGWRHTDEISGEGQVAAKTDGARKSRTAVLGDGTTTGPTAARLRASARVVDSFLANDRPVRVTPGADPRTVACSRAEHSRPLARRAVRPREGIG